MPELPEVETVTKDLRKTIVGRKIVDAWTDTPKLIKQMSFLEFKKKIVGAKILGVRRIAKNILIDLNGGMTMLVHLKMTGHFLIGRWKIDNKQLTINKEEKPIPIWPDSIKEKVNGYIRVIFVLDNNKMLGFSDMRKFGKIVLGKIAEINNLKELKKLGPEAIDKTLKFESFRERITSSKRTIKQVLLDQEKISGLGNIYADETLWHARVSPLKKVNKLKTEELKKLFKSAKFILHKGIKFRGTSIDDFRDASGKRGNYNQHILVYGREGEKCKRCKNSLIKRIKISGRSAHYCSICQR